MCRSRALRRGARGAYEVGVVRGIVEELDRTVRDPPPFRIFSGTSVGAINAAFLASQTDRGDLGVDRLVGLYEALDLGRHLRVDPQVLFPARMTCATPPPRCSSRARCRGWAVTGTLCGGLVGGTYADKALVCLACNFFCEVERAEGLAFIDEEDDYEALRKVVADLELPYPVALDPRGEILSKYAKGASIPLTFVVDRTGSIAFRHQNFEAGDEVAIERAIRAALQ